MAHTADPAAVVVDQENLIQGVAKHFLQKIFGAEGMPWGTQFSNLEELAVQIGQAVSRGMMDQALAGQAQAVPAAAQTCGVCGSPCVRGASGPTPGRHHHCGDGSLDRAGTLLPQMSGGFFSLSPGVWGLTRAATALMSKSRSSTQGCTTRRLPLAARIC